MPEKASDYYYTIDDPSIPKELLGPTGMIFVHPRGFSTELMVTIERDKKYYAFPLLVKDQEDIEGLLRGEKPTKAQIDRAFKANQGSPYMMTGDDEDELNKAIAIRHGLLERAMSPYIQSYLSRTGK